MSEPITRRAGSADAEILARIGAETFIETFAHLYNPGDLKAYLAEAYGLERTRADLADPAKAAWLVELDGQAIGYATAGPCALPHPDVTPACGELKRFYFYKAWQNGGMGRGLFAEVMAWLRQDSPRDIWLGVWSENHGAQRFYARQGFEKVGEYGFRVGQTIDREFILRAAAQNSASHGANSASNEHNPA